MNETVTDRNEYDEWRPEIVIDVDVVDGDRVYRLVWVLAGCPDTMHTDRLVIYNNSARATSVADAARTS